MKETFSYSILQYKHSILLKEAVNVGILFSFPKDYKFQFVSGNAHRVRAIYPDFELNTYYSIIKSIESKLKTYSSELFELKFSHKPFKELIHTAFLPEDSTVLQFTDPISVIDSFKDV